MFDSKSKNVPCVGVSLGVERIFSVLEAKNLKTRTTEVEVYVASAHNNLHEKRMEIIAMLWEANLKAEHSYKKNIKLLHQLQHCEVNEIPLAVILGDSELQKGEVVLREVKTRQQRNVPLEKLVFEIRDWYKNHPSDQ